MKDMELKGVVGQPLKVVFEAVGMPYKWRHNDVPQLEVTEEVIPQNIEEGIGGGPRSDFTVVAKAPGDYTLEFRLEPAWGGKAAETVNIKISVAP